MKVNYVKVAALMYVKQYENVADTKIFKCTQLRNCVTVTYIEKAEIYD